MRRLLPILAVALLLVLAGCTAGGSSYAADSAVVSDGVAENYDYSLQSVEKAEVNRTINVSEDRDYRVQLTNWATTYSKSSVQPQVVGENASPEIGFFALLSTPSVEVAGQELNPLITQSPGDLLKHVTERNDQITINEKVGERKVTHVQTQQEVTVEKYDADFQMDGQTVDGYVLASIVQTDGGIVITLGAYPEMIDDEEAIVDMITHVGTQEEPPETEV